MAAKVGQIVVDFFVNKAKFERDIKSAANSLKRTGREFTNIGAALTKSVTLPLVAAGAATIKFGAAFESAMTQSTAIMGKLSKSMRDDMEKTAFNVAKSTTFSAKQAAESYYYLASAGLDAQQSIAAMPQVAQFAQAGMFDMALATDLLTDAQSALGLTVKNAQKNLGNMTRVSDVLVRAATLSNATVQQFSESLTNKAGPALRSLGKDVEEGVAVLAAFADQGIKGAEAGTQFAIATRDLTTKALQNADAFKKFGIAVYDQNLNMRNMADIVADMERALLPMNDATKKATLLQLGFSDKSIQAQFALLGTSQKIRDYEKALRDAAGTTKDVAGKQLENFSAMMRLLGSRVEVAAIKMFQTLKPVLVDVIIPAFDKLITSIEEAVKWFSNLPRWVQGTSLAIAALAAAAGPVAYIFGTMATNIGVLLPLMGKAVVGLKAMATTAGLTKLGLIGLAAAAFIYKDELAGAVLKSLEFLGIMDDISKRSNQISKAVDSVSGVAIERYAQKLGISVAAMRELSIEHHNAIKVLHDHGAEVDKLKAAYDAGSITQETYMEGLREILHPAIRSKETTEDLTGKVKGLTSEMQELLDTLNNAPASLETVGNNFRQLGSGLDLMAGRAGAWKIEMESIGDLSYELNRPNLWEQTVARMHVYGIDLNKVVEATKVATKESEGFGEAARDAMKGWAADWSRGLNDMLWSADVTFGDILKSFGKMLTQMLIQYYAVQPLFNALTGWLGGGAATPSAKGNVFSGPIGWDGAALMPFARGGIVSTPKLFPMARGAGLMAEAGPEAIMPLTRIGGDLGVKATPTTVNINISTPAGTRADVSESTSGRGERNVNIVVSEVMAGEMARYGSPANRSLRLMGARSPIIRR